MEKFNAEAKQLAETNLEQTFIALFNKAATGDLSDLGITSGTTNPNSNTKGTIYIKYSN